MSNLKEYFDQNRYQSKYRIGDRVIGKYNKIPFVGTIGVDNVVNELKGPQVSILLDLPLIIDKKIHYVIIVNHKDIKPFK